MRKFKNKTTGVIEHVSNESLVEQYTKRPEIWEEVKTTKPTTKPEAGEENK